MEKQSWSWWVFHFVECIDIYTAHCSLTPVQYNLTGEIKPDTFKNLFLCEQQSNVNGPSRPVNELEGTYLWMWAATLWFRPGLQKKKNLDIYGMFAWSVGCSCCFTDNLSDCEGSPPFVFRGSNSDVQLTVGELQMVSMSSRLGPFLLCLVPLILLIDLLLWKKEIKMSVNSIWKTLKSDVVWDWSTASHTDTVITVCFLL